MIRGCRRTLQSSRTAPPQDEGAGHEAEDEGDDPRSRRKPCSRRLQGKRSSSSTVIPISGTAARRTSSNIHGKQFIDCFYAYHANLSPKEQLWDKAKFEKYSADDLFHDLFVDGPDDMAILNSTYLKDFYKNGFNTIERNAEVAKRYPDRFILNGAFDPRDGEKALEYIHYMKETYDIKGVKIYTAEWNGASKGWRLNDPDAYRCFELCEKLGIKNIHVHKGPTIIPLNKDAFDVHDVDHAATDFQNLNLIVEHCGLPRLDDFCWIAVQESNVYGGLAVALPFIHTPAALFRPGDGGAAVLARPGQDPVRLRLRDLDAAMAGRQVHGRSSFPRTSPRSAASISRSRSRRRSSASTPRGSTTSTSPRRRRRSRRRRSRSRRSRRDGAVQRQERAGPRKSWRAVGRVHDPELDEPVTDMGFVERIEVADDGSVELDFRLPTYWCSPNFAFLMLDGVRDALEALAWRPRSTSRCTITVRRRGEHGASPRARRSPRSSTRCRRGDDLAGLRETFLRKAFQRRQEAALLGLREAGWADDDI